MSEQKYCPKGLKYCPWKNGDGTPRTLSNCVKNGLECHENWEVFTLNNRGEFVKQCKKGLPPGKRGDKCLPYMNSPQDPPTPRPKTRGASGTSFLTQFSSFLPKGRKTQKATSPRNTRRATPPRRRKNIWDQAKDAAAQTAAQRAADAAATPPRRRKNIWDQAKDAAAQKAAKQAADAAATPPRRRKNIWEQAKDAAAQTAAQQAADAAAKEEQDMLIEYITTTFSSLSRVGIRLIINIFSLLFKTVAPALINAFLYLLKKAYDKGPRAFMAVLNYIQKFIKYLQTGSNKPKIPKNILPTKKEEEEIINLIEEVVSSSSSSSNTSYYSAVSSLNSYHTAEEPQNNSVDQAKLTENLTENLKKVDKEIINLVKELKNSSSTRRTKNNRKPSSGNRSSNSGFSNNRSPKNRSSNSGFSNNRSPKQ